VPVAEISKYIDLFATVGYTIITETKPDKINSKQEDLL